MICELWEHLFIFSCNLDSLLLLHAHSKEKKKHFQNKNTERRQHETIRSINIYVCYSTFYDFEKVKKKNNQDRI